MSLSVDGKISIEELDKYSKQIAKSDSSNQDNGIINDYSVKTDGASIDEEGETDLDKANSAINKAINKLKTFAIDDPELSSLLDERDSIVGEILSKTSDLNTSNSDSCIEKIKKEIEELQKEKLEIEEKIYDYIKDNSDYEFIASDLKTAIEDYKKAKEVQDAQQAQEEQQQQDAQNAQNAANNAQAAGGGGGVGGAGGAGNTPNTGNTNNSQEAKDTAEDANAAAQEASAYSFEFPEHNIENLETMSLEELRGAQQTLAGDLESAKSNLEEAKATYGGALQESEDKVNSLIDSIDQKLIDNDSVLKTLTDETKTINSNIKDTRANISTQENNISTAQNKIQKYSADLAALVAPCKSDYTSTRTVTDADGTTHTETVFNAAGYSAALSSYNAKKQACQTAIQVGKNELKAAKEAKKELTQQLKDLQKSLLTNAANIAKRLEEQHNLQEDGSLLRNASIELINAYDEYDREISKAEAILDQQVANLAALDERIAQKETTKEAEKEAIYESCIRDTRAELEKRKAELLAEAQARNGLGKLWDGAKGLFGGGTSGELAAIEAQLAALDEMERTGYTGKLDGISSIYASVTGSEPDQKAILESINVQLQLASGGIPTTDGNQITADAIADEMMAQVEALEDEFETTVNDQGIFSKGAAGIASFLGVGTTENMTKAQLAEYKNQVAKMQQAAKEGNYEAFAAAYKAVTGEDLTYNSLGGLYSGESKTDNSKAREAMCDYKSTNDNIKNTVISIGVGALTAATGGLAAAAVVGLGVTIGVNAIDAVTKEGGKNIAENLEYYVKHDLLKDALVGALNGFTGKLGNMAGDALVRRFATSGAKMAAQQAGRAAVTDATAKAIARGASISEKAMEQVFENAANATMKESLNFGRRVVTELVDGAVDAAVSSFGEYLVSSAAGENGNFTDENGKFAALENLKENYDAKEMLEQVVTSAVVGGLMSAGMQETARALGKLAQTVSDLKNEAVDPDMPKLDADADAPKLDADVDGPKVDADVDGPKVDTDVKMDVDTPKVDTDTPKVDVNNSKVDVNTPKVDTDVPKVDTDVPKVEVDVDKAKVGVDVDTPKVDTDTPKINTDTPKVDADANKPKVSTQTDKNVITTDEKFNGYKKGDTLKPNTETRLPKGTTLDIEQGRLDLDKLDLKSGETIVIGGGNSAISAESGVRLQVTATDAGYIVKDLSPAGETKVAFEPLVLNHRDGTTTIHKNLSAETYNKLFDGCYSNSMQGEIGDCYLLSAMNALYENSSGRNIILDCFEETADGDVVVKLPNGKFAKNMDDIIGEIAKDPSKYSKTNLGTKMLEYMYGLERYQTALDIKAGNIDLSENEFANYIYNMLNLGLGDMSDEIKFRSAGHPGEPMSMFGVETSSIRGANAMSEFLGNVDNWKNGDMVFTITTKSTPSGGGDNVYWYKDLDLVGKHVYLLQPRWENGRIVVDIKNPWHSDKVSCTLTIDQLKSLGCFNLLACAKVK